MVFLGDPISRDLGPALPVICANIVSSAVLNTLRSASSPIISVAKEALGRPVCFVAFGSLGRLEYVPRVSDLDSIIIVEGDVSKEVAADARSQILTPLARQAPWLIFDHHESIIQGRWQDIKAVEIAYPVIGTNELRGANSLSNNLMAQRRWQLLLESRVISNGKLFESIYHDLLPFRPNTRDLDFENLASEVTPFFGGFDNHNLLYKTQCKYFKTRFLRDYFSFASILIFVLGWFKQSVDLRKLPPNFIRASTATKMMRLHSFAMVLDGACKGNSALRKNYQCSIASILDKHKIDRRTLQSFGGHLHTSPGKYLHALLMNLLSLFVSCWRQIYDTDVRLVLGQVPPDLNLDSRFSHGLTGNEKTIVDNLCKLRDRYQRYMSATTEIIRDVFADGQVWRNENVPEWVRTSLSPFIRSTT